MITKFKYFKNFFLNYKNVMLKAIFYETIYSIIYSIKYLEFGSHILRSVNKNATDIVPCAYYFLHEISSFINEKKIKNIVDLGSGFGRTAIFLSDNTKANIFGYELNKEVFKKSLKLKNKNIKFFNKDIMQLNYSQIKSECFIMIDPFTRNEDTIKLQKKIIQSRTSKKNTFYLITVNINKKLLNKNFRNLKSIKTGKKGAINFLVKN
jgi:SAM-dependent methyltransferase|tara:strand:+ start:691 stop:1314 length:624 start_codon:yes stop_codon:yes gene_type:complete